MFTIKPWGISWISPGIQPSSNHGGDSGAMGDHRSVCVFDADRIQRNGDVRNGNDITENPTC